MKDIYNLKYKRNIINFNHVYNTRLLRHSYFVEYINRSESLNSISNLVFQFITRADQV